MASLSQTLTCATPKTYHYAKISRHFSSAKFEPHVPDAWINTANRDPKDGEIGKVGYEINFNRYFYTYQPPRPLEAIEVDIKLLEKDILEMLREVAG